MQWEIPIYEKAIQRGTVIAQRQGLRTQFRVDGHRWGEGVYKIWLREGQNELLLGTLMPEGERFRLERVISNAMLREKGVERCTSALARKEGEDKSPMRSAAGAQRVSLAGQSGAQEKNPLAAEQEWLPVQTLCLPDLEPELAAAIRSLKGGRWRSIPEGIQVSCPWTIGQQMPCMPLFCFASWSTQKGGVLTWFLDERGNPLLSRYKVPETVGK